MTTQKALIKVASICFRVVVFLAVVLGLIYLGKTTYKVTHVVFSEEAMEEAPGRTVKVKLSEEVSAERMAEVLEENNLIEDAFVLRVQMKIADFEGPVAAGEYELNTSMTPTEMFEILSRTNED